jgi:hypothetical protein
MFEELMSYYYFEFNVHYFLGAIILINTIKVTKDYINVRTNNNFKIIKFKSSYFDLITSIFVMLGLCSGAMFQGVLSDISTEYSQIWTGKMIIIFITSFILLIMQLVFSLLLLNYKRKD